MDLIYFFVSMFYSHISCIESIPHLYFCLECGIRPEELKQAWADLDPRFESSPKRREAPFLKSNQI